MTHAQDRICTRSGCRRRGGWICWISYGPFLIVAPGNNPFFATRQTLSGTAEVLDCGTAVRVQGDTD